MSLHIDENMFDFNPETLPKVAHKTLVIGDLKRWRAAGRDTMACSHFQFAGLDDLTAEVIAAFDPEIILSPLVGTSFDVLEVAEKLQQINFKGRYRAICTDIPDVEIIRSDVSQVAPDLDFDLFQVPSDHP